MVRNSLYRRVGELGIIYEVLVFLFDLDVYLFFFILFNICFRESFIKDFKCFFRGFIFINDLI